VITVGIFLIFLALAFVAIIAVATYATLNRINVTLATTAAVHLSYAMHAEEPGVRQEAQGLAARIVNAEPTT
jgi:hypothetical protein